MTIIVLTNTLQNGQLADAAEVMGDLQQIVNVVNGELDADNITNNSLTRSELANNLWLVGAVDGSAVTPRTGFSGFSVTRNAVGDYTVTFTAALPVTPAITVTPFFAGGAIAHRMIERDASHFRVIIYDLTGADVNSDFDFIAHVP